MFAVKVNGSGMPASSEASATETGTACVSSIIWRARYALFGQEFAFEQDELTRDRLSFAHQDLAFLQAMLAQVRAKPLLALVGQSREERHIEEHGWIAHGLARY